VTEKILLVDDDPNVLRAYKRQLRKQFVIDTELGGEEGLRAISESGPYAVIVSDMRMPGMDGVQFLAKVREVSVDTVRMMLTGNADQQTAISAVNEGQIFRFLNKPCPPEIFAKSLRDGLQQYRLVTAERELLQGTLMGTVNLMTGVLSVVNPKAFGRVAVVQQLVRDLCLELGIEDAWEVEMAAAVGQIGSATLPDTTLEKLAQGVQLSREELEAYRAYSKVGRDLVADIPRLERIARIIDGQDEHADVSATRQDDCNDGRTQMGAHILQLARDCDMHHLAGLADDETLEALRRSDERYTPELLDTLAKVMSKRSIQRRVTVDELRSGMVLLEPVVTKSGNALLVSSGQQVTAVMRSRLESFMISGQGVREPIRVRQPMTADASVTS